ncbi:CIA30 family protein [Mycobacterium sp. IDR2000157661]|nr:CIA30 family protein [Mycobacterium sp. IDR2000157661]
MRRGCRRGLVGIAIACSALLVVSCGSAGRSANADKTTNTPGAPGSSAQAPVSEGRDVALVDLGDANEVAGWTTVNDPVMGGRSTSTITFGAGGLVFSGDISLENNGGFASARSPQDPEIGRRAAGATSLRVHAVGDGKTYVLRVGDAGQPWSYIQRFATEAGISRIYELPIAGFQPVGTRLDPAPDAPQTLDPSSINQVAVYILDKQQGRFEITISAIDATA